MASQTTTDNQIPEDFLEVDNPIPGQNFCLLSFVSPENVLEDKKIFFLHKFMENFSKEYKLEHSELQSKYKDFLYSNEENLDKEFYENNNFNTSMRGLKVRGVYDTLKEANSKAKKIQQNDKSFSVFVGQVGYWLPWDPSSDKIESQEYSEKQLNELVKCYKENQEKKNQHFQENIDYVKEQNQKSIENKSEDEEPEVVNTLHDTESVDQVTTVLDTKEDDPWMKNKKGEE